MGLFERIRGEGDAAMIEDEGAGIAGRLGSLARRGGALVDRVADGVKDVASRGLLKDAAEAQARGNMGAAFYLAKEACEAEPDDVKADGFFWDVALAFGQPEAARGSAANLVAYHVAQGAPELAAQYFSELATTCGAPLIDPAMLVRVIPELITRLERSQAEAGEGAEAGQNAEAAKPDESVGDDASVAGPAVHRGTLVQALRLCVDPENAGLSPGLAMRVAELARPFESSVALAAARHALDADDVHEAKRAKLVALVRELDPDAEIADALEVDDADLDVAVLEVEAEDFSDAEYVDRIASGDVVVASDSPLGVANPVVVPVSDAEADRLTAMLEPAEEELEIVAEIEHTDSEMLPELAPIDDFDPARNHPQRIESPAHEALTEDEIGRMRARVERALSAKEACAERDDSSDHVLVTE